MHEITRAEVRSYGISSQLQSQQTRAKDAWSKGKVRSMLSFLLPLSSVATFYSRTNRRHHSRKRDVVQWWKLCDWRFSAVVVPGDLMSPIADQRAATFLKPHFSALQSIPSNVSSSRSNLQRA